MIMKNIFIQLLIFCFVFGSCKKDEIDPVIKEMSSVKGYRDWFIGDFRCGLFVPPNYYDSKKYPLIIYLHGYSDTTTWNMGWYLEPIVTDDPCIVLTPKCPIDEFYGWGDSFDKRISPMMEKTLEMLEIVEKAFNLDKERYYIHGTSMGGYGTYGILQKKPDMFAAAYVECGLPNSEIAPIIKNIPIWIFHGSIDNVVPVQPDRNLYMAVKNLGGTQIKYTEYVGVGHNTWDYTRYETTLKSWLLAQRKGSVHSAPANIRNFEGELFPDNKVFLQWDIPQENEQTADNKVWYCKIYRNDELFKEIYNSQNNCIDSTILASNNYEYKISAVNYYFKESVQSEVLTFDLNK